VALDHLSRRLITLALEEDLGPGDVTAALLDPDATGRAIILAKSPLVVAGIEAFVEAYHQVDPTVEVAFEVRDGDRAAPGTSMGTVHGLARSLLTGERTALNLLQRLSGVATMARRAQDAVAGTKAKVVDTRKTTPGMRSLEKAAVRAGGAYNHRMGLYDGLLVKDNHVRAAGGVKPAIEAARKSAHHLLKVECEVTTLAEVEDALSARAEVILLDNMDTPTMKAAVELIAGRALVEASGNVTLERLPEIAATGVDLISMGALTHSAKAADISLEWDA
jgi:nicotinate-nucleotide pyrophosphorylase (carboxylating)